MWLLIHAELKLIHAGIKVKQWWNLNTKYNDFRYKMPL